MQQVRINGLVVFTGPDEQARRYAGDILRQLSDQHESRGVGQPERMAAYLRDAASGLELGLCSRFITGQSGQVPGIPLGSPLEIEVTDAPAGEPCTLCGGTGVVPGSADYDGAVHMYNPAMEPCDCVVTGTTTSRVTGAHAIVMKPCPSSATTPARDGHPSDADDHGQDYEAQAHATCTESSADGMEAIAAALAMFDAGDINASDFAERVREQIGDTDVTELAPGGERIR